MSGLFDASLVRSVMPTLPNVFTMTLRNKITQGGNSTDAGEVADGYGPAKSVKVRRRPCTEEELVSANVTRSDSVITFSVLDDGSFPNFVKPEEEARIVDEVGGQWTVKKIKATALETVFSCVCFKGW